MSRLPEERWRIASDAYETELARAFRDPHLWLDQAALTASSLLRWCSIPFATGCISGLFAKYADFDSGRFAGYGFIVGFWIAGALILWRPTDLNRSLFHERADAAFAEALQKFK